MGRPGQGVADHRGAADHLAIHEGGQTGDAVAQRGQPGGDDLGVAEIAGDEQPVVNRHRLDEGIEHQPVIREQRANLDGSVVDRQRAWVFALGILFHTERFPNH
ncbi:hypothetical protein D9M70_562380 [compost metagenome]